MVRLDKHSNDKTKRKHKTNQEQNGGEFGEYIGEQSSTTPNQFSHKTLESMVVPQGLCINSDEGIKTTHLLVC